LRLFFRIHGAGGSQSANVGSRCLCLCFPPSFCASAFGSPCPRNRGAPRAWSRAALPPPSPKLDPPHYHPVHPDSGRPKRARARRYPRVILSLDAARWSYQEGRV
ncbi:hypothetical protein B0H13DRAFT_2667483, partial [Mycena leptocephala]